MSESEAEMISKTDGFFINDKGDCPDECFKLERFLISPHDGLSEEEIIDDANMVGIDVSEMGKYEKYKVSSKNLNDVSVDLIVNTGINP